MFVWVAFTDEGGLTAGSLFVDMSNTNALERRQWSSKAPQWRVAMPGLSVEGVCTNRECEAFDRSVIINKHHGTFDLLLDAHTYVSCVRLRVMPLASR
jgi:hypothetical protein